MYNAVPLTKEKICCVASIMAETNNISALHTISRSLEEWKIIFADNENDSDEENFLIFSDSDVCAWLKLNGLLNHTTAWISMLAVSDKYKHKGAGSFAVSFAVGYLKQKGFSRIGIQTTQDNVPAINLYKKLGFSISEQRKGKAEDGAKIRYCIFLKNLGQKHYSLHLPDVSHENAYIDMMDKWEKIEDNIQPELLRRYSNKLKTAVSYSMWLEWCKDDRTTGSMLSTGVPCTLYFLVDDTGEILGAIEINQRNTHRGHLHAGIVPWRRGEGLGTKMLKLALEICKNSGLTSIDAVPYKSNKAAVNIIIKNGGVLKEEFFEEGKWSQRYTISINQEI